MAESQSERKQQFSLAREAAQSPRGRDEEPEPEPEREPLAEVDANASASTPWNRRAEKVRPDWSVFVGEKEFALHRVFLAAGATDTSSGSAFFRRVFRASAAASAAVPTALPQCTRFGELPPGCGVHCFETVLAYLYDGGWGRGDAS